MKGVRSLETFCTVCETMAGVKEHMRSQKVVELKVSRHAVPGADRTRTPNGRRVAPICGGSGIAVTEAVVFRVEVSA